MTADVADAVVATVDDEVRYWQGYDDYDLKQLRTSAAAIGEGRPSRRTCPRLFYVWSHESESVVGQYSVAPPPTKGQPYSLGWWLSPQARGHGYGRESLRSMLDYAHTHLGLLEISMGTSEANVRARRQIEAAGSTYVLTRDHKLPNGEIVKARWYTHSGQRGT